MKDDAEAVKRPSGEHEPQRQGPQRPDAGVLQHDSAPAEHGIEPVGPSPRVPDFALLLLVLRT